MHTYNKNYFNQRTCKSLTQPCKVTHLSHFVTGEVYLKVKIIFQ